ncbi:MAG: prenyltransferase/squalene oxidase repeat-containing protein [Phycisphaerae bacterium]
MASGSLGHGTRRWFHRVVLVGYVLLGSVVWGAGPASAPESEVAGAAAGKDTVVVDQKTDAAIKGALKYLAAKQGPDGAWASPDGEHPVAVTAYTLMAFLATGHLPNEGEYGKNVQQGVKYLLSCVRADGFITSVGVNSNRRSDMYDHGIATIALAEIYGQTQDPQVRAKLATSIQLIIKVQNKQGGWRYTPGATDSDISVTVLQVVALRAAKNGGLDVPQKTIERAVAYIKTCFDPRTGGFFYQPNNGLRPSATAAGIYSLQVCGLYDDPMVAKGSGYLMGQGRNGSEFFTYGNFIFLCHII